MRRRPGLLRRVFATDVLSCPCGGRRSVVAVVVDSAMALAVLAMRSPGPNGRLIPAAEMHEIGLAELNREFATILTTDELLTLL